MGFAEAYKRGHDRAEAEHAAAIELAYERLAAFEASTITDRSDLAEMGLLRAQIEAHETRQAATRGIEAA